MSARSLPEQFRGFADSVESDGATTYAAICRGVADDPDVLALLREAPLAQRRPNILLAAVHFLLLSGVPHALADHFDTVRPPDPDDDPRRARDHGEVAADFKAFCVEHHDEVLDLVTRRRTQTNEVGRCAALLPAISSVAERHAGEPLSLLDLGASAGLNLLFDRYAYAYRQRSDGKTARVGDPASPVMLECTVRGELEALPPLAAPPIGARFGLDIAPLSPSSEDDARWLLACLWPDNLARFARLREALAVARSAPHPPRLCEGDVVHDLPGVAATIEGDAPLVVFHSWMAAYLTATQQAELVDAVRDVAATRPVHYLYAEQASETPGLPTPPTPQPSARSHLRTALVHLDLSRNGVDRPPVRLADMHPHGRWLHWWGSQAT